MLSFKDGKKNIRKVKSYSTDYDIFNDFLRISDYGNLFSPDGVEDSLFIFYSVQA